MEQRAVIIPVAKLCECGCGERTNLIKKRDRNRGLVKGQPWRFILGHNSRILVREKNSNWKGGRSNTNGYVLISQPSHPRAHPTKGYVLEHILIAEKALGKFLPLGAEVHHVNGIRSDNRNSNLVICENHDFHMLLHARRRALLACGNPNWRTCKFCKQWDDVANLHYSPTASRGGYHKTCCRDYDHLRNLKAT